MYYYKCSTGILKLKEPLSPLPKGYTELTEQEYETELANVSVRAFQPNEIKRQIASLKKQLAKTDYQAIKYAEGWISEQDYATIKAQRQTMRDQINELEAELEEESE